MKKTKIGVMVNSSLSTRITKRTIFGAEHIVIEGAGSIIGDSVMNGIYYPMEQVKKLASDSTSIIHAPVSHPMDEAGNFISAGSPQGVHQGYIGAISYNYRMDGDRLVRDIAIDIEKASQSANGREVLRRIENGEDTDTSTGLLMYVEEVSGYGRDGEPYAYVAGEMVLDHDAILLEERGAATSLQGVGMFANSEGDDEELEFCSVTVNASMPSMNMPVANGDHEWSEADAITRIREYTNSADKPSHNYRRFFVQFDRDNADSFDAYKMPFADIIDGVPHAVQAALENAKSKIQTEIADEEKETAMAIVNAYLDKIKKKSVGNSESGIIASLKEKLNSLIEFASSLGYNGNRTDDKSTSNNQEDNAMREMIINALKAAGVNTDGMTDEQLLEAHSKLTANAAGGQGQEGAADNAKAIADAVANALKPLQDEVSSLKGIVNAKNDSELEALSAKVESLKIGINKEQAKALGLEAVKGILTANNVQVGFDVSVGNFKGDKADEMQMPAY